MARTQRGWRDRKVFASAITKETVYGTANATPVDSLFRVNTAPFKLEKNRTPDTDLVGGAEEPGDFDELSRLVRGSIGLPYATPHFLAFIFSYALGAVTTTTPEVGKTARMHEITPKASNYLLDAFTMEEILAVGIQKQYTGCLIDTATLRVKNGGWYEATADIVGSGKVATGSAAPSAIAETFLGARDTKIWYSVDADPFDGTMTQSKTTSDLTTPVAITTVMREFEWSVKNNIPVDELREFNSGLYLARGERDRRSQDLSVTLEYMENDPFLDYFLATASEQDIGLEFETYGSVLAGDAVSTYLGSDLIFPQLRLRDYDFPEALGKSLLKLNFDVMQHPDDGSVRFGVVNAQTGYLQAAA